MEVGTEFYWDDEDGYEQAYIVLSLHAYLNGQAATLQWRDHTGRSLGQKQMMVNDMEVELDDLAGSWRHEPRAEQKKLKGKGGR